MPGLLTDMLHHLDIPSDARLMSVTASTDPVDGAMVWTVQYKAVPTPPLSSSQQRETTAVQRETAIQTSRSTQALPGLGGIPSSRSRSAFSRPESPRAFASVEPAVVAQLPPRIDIPSSLTFPMMQVLGAPPAEVGHLMRCFQLKCIVQTYAWGKIGLDSAVARIAFSEGALNDDIELEESSPYAELWMGTHPSGPSLVVLEQPWKTITPLSEWLKHNPELGGSKVRLPTLLPACPLLVRLCCSAVVPSPSRHSRAWCLRRFAHINLPALVPPTRCAHTDRT